MFGGCARLWRSLRGEIIIDEGLSLCESGKTHGSLVARIERSEIRVRPSRMSLRSIQATVLSIGDPHWRSIGKQEMAVRDNGFAA
jgi:hypothetical protein